MMLMPCHCSADGAMPLQGEDLIHDGKQASTAKPSNCVLYNLSLSLSLTHTLCLFSVSVSLPVTEVSLSPSLSPFLPLSFAVSQVFIGGGERQKTLHNQGYVPRKCSRPSCLRRESSHGQFEVRMDHWCAKAV